VVFIINNTKTGEKRDKKRPEAKGRKPKAGSQRPEVRGRKSEIKNKEIKETVLTYNYFSLKYTQTKKNAMKQKKHLTTKHKSLYCLYYENL